MMATWRDAASQEAQDDLDGLIGTALEFAQQQIAAYGEFYPYAIVVDREGQQRVIAADTDADQPDSADLVASLVRTLGQQHDLLRSTAIVADVRVSEIRSDAVRVNLEHAEGVALTVLLPYRPQRFGRRVEYGGLSVSAASALIWRTDSSQSG